MPAGAASLPPRTVSSTRIPKYRLHRGTGQAVVTLSGPDIYLGRHGAAESKEHNERTIATWLLNDRCLPAAKGSAGPRIAEVLDGFARHAQRHYVHPDRTPTREHENYLMAVGPLRTVYASLPAGEFGPKGLEAVREKMITLGWCRKTVNRHVARIQQVFRWALAQEFVTSSVYQALLSVTPLQCGRTEAPEHPEVKPVPLAHIDAVLPLVAGQIRAMIQLQLLTGARPAEVCGMRPMDIERRGDVWTYSPAKHKNAFRGQRRVIFMGPKAEQVLRPFLLNRAEDAYLFSPAEAELERRQIQRKERKTPVQPS